MTATATLWSSETLVSTAVKFYKILVTNKLLYYGFSGFFGMPFFNKMFWLEKHFIESRLPSVFRSSIVIKFSSLQNTYLNSL